MIPSAFYSKVDSVMNEDMNYIQLKYCTLYFDKPKIFTMKAEALEKAQDKNKMEEEEKEEVKIIPEYQRCGGCIAPLSSL